MKTSSEIIQEELNKILDMPKFELMIESIKVVQSFERFAETTKGFMGESTSQIKEMSDGSQYIHLIDIEEDVP